MYRVKVFREYAPYEFYLEEKINEFLIGKDIEIVNCTMSISEDNHITYIIMYQQW